MTKNKVFHIDKVIKCQIKVQNLCSSQLNAQLIIAYIHVRISVFPSNSEKTSIQVAEAIASQVFFDICVCHLDGYGKASM